MLTSPYLTKERSEACLLLRAYLVEHNSVNVSQPDGTETTVPINTEGAPQWLTYKLPIAESDPDSDPYRVSDVLSIALLPLGDLKVN